MADWEKWLEKHGLRADNILYLYRRERKTVIHREDGEEFALFAPLHTLLSLLPESDFLSINKGVAVSRGRIIGIDRNGIYTMSDGQTFQGRKRGLGAHRHLQKQMGLSALPEAHPQPVPMHFLEKCTLLDAMPLAYCVIELVFNADGHGVDFIFRYCNAEMSVMEGVPVEKMLNRSFYEVFRNGDKKWLVAYADVALNGTRRILHDYSPEIGKYLTIYCYQPEPGFCACVLQTADA